MKHFLFLLLFLPLSLFCQTMGSTTLEIKALPQPSAVDNDVNSFMSQWSETRFLSEEQREWFYWTNYSRKNPRRFWDSVVLPILEVYPKFRNDYTSSLKKELYSATSLPMVKPNTKLSKAAYELASELVKSKSTPSHTSPSGLTFQDRMSSANIKACAGENISFGTNNTILMLTLLYIDEGVPGYGHRRTLLDPAFKEMGIGIAAYPDKKLLVVQDFACEQ